jgi:hypothetical protein
VEVNAPAVDAYTKGMLPPGQGCNVDPRSDCLSGELAVPKSGLGEKRQSRRCERWVAYDRRILDAVTTREIKRQDAVCIQNAPGSAIVGLR